MGDRRTDAIAFGGVTFSEETRAEQAGEGPVEVLKERGGGLAVRELNARDGLAGLEAAEVAALGPAGAHQPITLGGQPVDARVATQRACGAPVLEAQHVTVV